MNRRTALAVVGGLAVLPGCGGFGGSPATATGGQTPTASDGSPRPPATTDDLEVVGLSAPESVPVTEPYEFAVRVHNPTDRPGAFRSPLSLQVGNGEWRSLEGAVGGRVGAGATRSLSASLPAIAYLGTYRLRLDAVGRTWSFETAPRRLAFGTAFDAPSGLSVVVAGVSFATSYTGGGNGTTARTPPSGSTWAVVTVRVSNPTGEPVQFAPFGAFSLSAAGTRHAVALSDPRDRVRIVGDWTDFELLFVLPADTTKREVTVRWTPSYGGRRTAAEWSGVDG